MCGIAGWLDWESPVNPQLVQKITDALSHRGPDASGVKELGPIVLGHRRLSIIDTASTNDQPLSDTSNDYWIVFNGEIYNYLELRRQLESHGSKFRTQGDTEVILEAYKHWGAECLGRLNGMFSFALWDARTQRLLIARDRLGEKPLFYCLPSASSIAFASEPQALRKFVPGYSQVDPAILGQFLALNYTVGARWLVKGIFRLPPAHFMLFERQNQPQIKSYWDLSAYFKNKNTFTSEEEAADRLAEMIEQSVSSRLVSDVPLGAFLSGGIDSSAIVGAMARLGDASKVKTFSIGFQEPSFDEVDEARAASKYLAVDHYDRSLSPAPDTIMKSILKAAEEPLADSSFLPTYCLAELARERVTVALSGDGGDEIFAGYETYSADKFHRAFNQVPRWMSTSVERLAASVLPVSFNKVSFDYKAKQFLAGLQFDSQRAHYSWRNIFSDQERLLILRPEWRTQINAEHPFDEFEKHFQAVTDCHYIDQAMYVDIKTWLPDNILVKVDRATMAHSLEARAPFLDHRLVEFAASLPADLKLKGLRKKHILKESQRKTLPEWILNRKKKGFNAPVSYWLNGQLKMMAREVMHDSCMKEWFVTAEITRLWDEHERKQRDNGLRLLGLTLFGLWLKAHA
jgi:asparagine synthase (glutamine-hydrolysing)